MLTLTYAESHILASYAECRHTLSVVMLSVVAPTNGPNKLGCYITIESKSLIETNTLAYWEKPFLPDQTKIASA
jgi:hypothetical protein